MTRDLETPPNKVWSHRKIAKTQKEHKDAVDLRQGNNPNKGRKDRSPSEEKSGSRQRAEPQAKSKNRQKPGWQEPGRQTTGPFERTR